MIPQITPDIVRNIQVQIERGHNIRWGNTYIQNIVEELKKENPVLGKAIIDTSEAITNHILKQFDKHIDGGIEDDVREQTQYDGPIDTNAMHQLVLEYIRVDIFNGMCCLALSVYQAIKQQMIVEELES